MLNYLPLPSLLPTHPGASPVYPPNTTITKQLEISYKFDKKTTLFGLHYNLDKALKLQILASMVENYMWSLKAKHVAYINLICLKVITHLINNNNRITFPALKDNSVKMIAAYDANQPLKTNINQIETAFILTNTVKVTYTPKQVDIST